MRIWCLIALCCALAAGCSTKPGTSFGFVDGKPIHVVKAGNKEAALELAGERCRGAFTVLEEGAVSRHTGGWVDPARNKIEDGYFVRAKCDDH